MNEENINFDEIDYFTWMYHVMQCECIDDESCIERDKNGKVVCYVF